MSPNVLASPRRLARTTGVIAMSAPARVSMSRCCGCHRFPLWASPAVPSRREGLSLDRWPAQLQFLELWRIRCLRGTGKESGRVPALRYTGFLLGSDFLQRGHLRWFTRRKGWSFLRERFLSLSAEPSHSNEYGKQTNPNRSADAHRSDLFRPSLPLGVPCSGKCSSRRSSPRPSESRPGGGCVPHLNAPTPATFLLRAACCCAPARN